MNNQELFSLVKYMHKKAGVARRLTHECYFQYEPKTITCDNFFEIAVWAIWVAGMTAKAVESFLNKALDAGFSYDVQTIALWSKAKVSTFLKKLHAAGLLPRAEKKWMAVFAIAKKLNSFSSNQEMRDEFFSGKAKGRNLNEEDVESLKSAKLPFIGPANSQFIVRRYGGDAVKIDRWLKLFIHRYKMNSEKFIFLKQKKVTKAMLDVLVWYYCAKFIKRTNEFSRHMTRIEKVSLMASKRLPTRYRIDPKTKRPIKE